MSVSVQTSPPRASSERGLLRSWTVWTTAGEAVGFCVPAVTAALVVDGSSTVAVPSLLLAGAAEGAVLGAAQAHVLRRALPGLPPRQWAAATAAGATLAWAISLPLLIAGENLATWPAWLIWPVVAVGGTALLLSIGVAQWSVLRRHAPLAGRWIAVTAVAWLAGLTVFMLVAPPLWHEGQAAVTTIAIGVLAGLLMAATVAVITGVGLVRLLRHRSSASPGSHAPSVSPASARERFQ